MPRSRLLIIDTNVEDLHRTLHFLNHFSDEWEISFESETEKSLQTINELQPDLIIADHALKTAAGKDVWQQARTRYPRTQFVLTSATAGEFKDPAPGTGQVLAYVEKSHFQEQLVPLLERLTQERRSAAQLPSAAAVLPGRSTLAAGQPWLRPGEAAIDIATVRYYHQVIRNMVTGVLTIDVEGNILFCNDMIGQFLGCPAHTLPGRSIKDFIYPQDSKAYVNAIASISRAYPKTSFDCRLFGTQKDPAWYTLHATLLEHNAHGDAQEILFIISDISALKHVEEKLKLQARQLATFNSELEEAVRQRTKTWEQLHERLHQQDELKRQFVANISHEFRTPISTLLLYTGLLKDGGVSPEYHEYLTGIEEECQRLRLMVDQVLRFNSYRDQSKKAKEPVELLNLAQELLAQFRLQAKARGIELVEHLVQEACQVQACREALWHIVHNLLSNALKFTGPGKRVIFRLFRNDQQMQLSVSDEGCGIHPDDLQHVFDPFYQGRTQLREKPDGTGLGLNIVKVLAEEMDINVTLKSEWGQGTQVILTFMPETSP